MKLLIFIILIIFVFPTINFGGIPIRIEDIFFLTTLIFFPKLKNTDYKPLVTILTLTVLSNLISFAIQFSEKYRHIHGWFKAW